MSHHVIGFCSASGEGRGLRELHCVKKPQEDHAKARRVSSHRYRQELVDAERHTESERERDG